MPSKMISKNISLLLFKRRSKGISKHRLVTRKGLLHSNQDGEMFDDKYQANNIPAKRLKEAVHIGVPKPLIDSYCLNKHTYTQDKDNENNRSGNTQAVLGSPQRVWIVLGYRYRR